MNPNDLKNYDREDVEAAFSNQTNVNSTNSTRLEGSTNGLGQKIDDIY